MQTMSLLQRIALLEGLTPGEKKLAEYFEEKNTQLAFENLATISANVNLGKSTVTRFVQRLGYASFTNFSRSVRSEVRTAMDVPFEGYAKEKMRQKGSPVSNVVARMEQVMRNMQHAIEINAEKQFADAVSLLADSNRHLYIIGGATAYSLAYYAFLLLRYLRSNVTLLDADIATLPHRLAGCENNAALFAISFYRFSRSTQKVMRLFHDAGRPVLFLTDRHVNPLIALSACHIIAPSEGEHTIFSSRAAGMALVEALIAAAAPPSDQSMQERLSDMENIFTALDAFNLQ